MLTYENPVSWLANTPLLLNKLTDFDYTHAMRGYLNKKSGHFHVRFLYCKLINL
jgi:hypothetical protein